jgi:hypothetical protein
MAYLIGDTIRLKATIMNLDDIEAAPAAIDLTIYREDGETKLLVEEAGTLEGGTTAQYYVDWTISAESYTVAFDSGNELNPIEAGDNLTGSVAGVALCYAIEYLTAATGTITYIGTSSQFVNLETITGGGNTVAVVGTPAASTDYLAEAETLIAVWSWTGPHLKRIDFEAIPEV